MKLYYAPGACSLAPHIVSREAGLDLELEKVDLGAHKTAGGDDYYAVNPKGYVPALKLDDGQILTEVANLVQYLADKKPGSGLAPTAGTMERYRLGEWLTFISSEIHKGFSPLFDPSLSEDSKQAGKTKVGKRLTWLDKELSGRDFLTGKTFSAADAYAFTVLNWAGMLKIDLAPYPSIRAYMDRVAARPKVQEALRAEGLLQAAAA